MTTDELRAKFEEWYPNAIGDVQPFECYMKGYASRDAEVEALRADRDSWAEQASERVKDWDEMRQLTEKAAVERDALRQRIESAPVVEVTACNQIPGASDFDYGQLSAAFAGFKTGQRVRLVVEVEE